MKRIIKIVACLLVSICLIVPVPSHAASFGISASTGSVSPGGTFTVYISSSGTGPVNVYASNGTVSTNYVWVEVGTVSVTVRAGSSGYCTVVASTGEGFSDENAQEVNLGSRSTSVAIKSSSGGGGGSSSSRPSASRPGRAETVDEETGKSYAIAAIEKHTYSGEKIEPEVKVTCDGDALTKDTDYTVKYENNVNAGTAKVIVQGKGSHDFSLEGAFTIEAKDISKLKVSTIGDQRFTGKEIKPGVELKDGKTVLEEEKDYTVKYENNVNMGTATVTITGTGNYTGTVNIEFSIIKTLFDPGCASHWAILGIGLVGAALLAVFRKKENIALAVMAAGVVINTIVAFAAGNCTGEWIMAYFGLVVMILVKWLTSGSGMGVLENVITKVKDKAGKKEVEE